MSGFAMRTTFAVAAASLGLSVAACSSGSSGDESSAPHTDRESVDVPSALPAETYAWDGLTFGDYSEVVPYTDVIAVGTITSERLLPAPSTNRPRDEVSLVGTQILAVDVTETLRGDLSSTTIEVYGDEVYAPGNNLSDAYRITPEGTPTASVGSTYLFSLTAEPDGRYRTFAGDAGPLLVDRATETVSPDDESSFHDDMDGASVAEVVRTIEEAPSSPPPEPRDPAACNAAPSEAPPASC